MGNAANCDGEFGKINVKYIPQIINFEGDIDNLKYFLQEEVVEINLRDNLNDNIHEIFKNNDEMLEILSILLYGSNFSTTIGAESMLSIINKQIYITIEPYTINFIVFLMTSLVSYATQRNVKLTKSDIIHLIAPYCSANHLTRYINNEDITIDDGFSDSYLIRNTVTNGELFDELFDAAKNSNKHKHDDFCYLDKADAEKTLLIRCELLREFVKNLRGKLKM